MRVELEELSLEWAEDPTPTAEPPDDPDTALVEQVRAILAFQRPPPPPGPEGWMERLHRKLFGG